MQLFEQLNEAIQTRYTMIDRAVEAAKTIVDAQESFGDRMEETLDAVKDAAEDLVDGDDEDDPKRTSPDYLWPVLVAVGSPLFSPSSFSALMPAGIYIWHRFSFFPFSLFLGFPSDQPHSFLTSHCLRLFAKIIKFLARTEPVPPEIPPVISPNFFPSASRSPGPGNHVDPHTFNGQHSTLHGRWQGDILTSYKKTPSTAKLERGDSPSDRSLSVLQVGHSTTNSSSATSESSKMFSNNRVNLLRIQGGRHCNIASWFSPFGHVPNFYRHPGSDRHRVAG
ncbi:MAG: hypothetical protein Ct9H300mP10_06150 [Methanobacteriota archaeon]|nr:MAG: hypothetical protein Ct9H300mP10_06150 [Euryarchaeota archaeon]